MSHTLTDIARSEEAFGRLNSLSITVRNELAKSKYNTKELTPLAKFGELHDVLDLVSGSSNR